MCESAIASTRIAFIVPSRNGRDELARCLASVAVQSIGVELMVVDSDSSDGTPAVAVEHGARLVRIRAREFNHGRTRQMMVERHPDYGIYVFMTQDAYLEDAHALARLVAPFADARVGAVCGRQLPHRGASPVASHARAFNYPPASRVVALEDAPELGLRAPFMSNSFAAYRAEALNGVGGFPKDVILAEDMHVAARMLLQGWKIAYAGDACCRHSHEYGLIDEFRRYFDIGVFHGREGWIRERFGGAGGEGLRYVLSELRHLGLAGCHRWPVAIVRNAMKLLGYRLGSSEAMLPRAWKCRLSMHGTYWERADATGG